MNQLLVFGHTEVRGPREADEILALARSLLVKLDGVEKEIVVEMPRSSCPPSLPSRAVNVLDDSQDQEKGHNFIQNNNVLLEARAESSKMTVLSTPTSADAVELEANQIVAASEVFSCVKCPAKTAKTYKSKNQLHCHYIKHFLKEIRTCIKDDNGCNMCGKKMSDDKRLLLHVGITHKVIQYILSREGIVVYPQPSSSSFGANANASTSDQSSSSSVANSIPSSSATRSFLMSSGSTKKRAKHPVVCAMLDKSDQRVPAQEDRTPLPDPGRINGPGAPENTAEDLPRQPSVQVEARGNQRVQPPVQAEEGIADDDQARLDNAESSGGSNVGCNFSLQCEVCSQEFRAQHTLQQHYVRHFQEEVEEEVHRYFLNFLNSPWFLKIMILDH